MFPFKVYLFLLLVMSFSQNRMWLGKLPLFNFGLARASLGFSFLCAGRKSVSGGAGRVESCGGLGNFVLSFTF